MPLLPNETYWRYVKFLEDRLKDRLEDRIARKQHLTEDSVRYSFFAAALQTTTIQQHEIILERPHHHPEFEGKEIDMHIQPSTERPELYVEFKFHRKTGSASPTPLKAGSLFKDFSRLSSIATDQSHCLVIYLTDFEMAEYFKNKADTYSNFWRVPTEGTFIYDDTFINNTTDTFKKASGILHKANVRVEFSAELTENYHLRIFEVRKI
jgi:hypothetical protein